MSSWSSHAIAFNAPFAYLLIHLYHIWSQEEALVAVQEEQIGSDPQEIQAQKVPKVDEQEEDLPKCVDHQPNSVDHQPNSFERGKPWSILSLLFYKSNSLYIYI
jgi:hypothetical protein